MRHGFIRKLLIFLITLVVFKALPIHAQVAETDGIRFGAFSIHPSLFTAMRYNDNVYFVPNNYRPENDRSIPQSIESDLVFNVVPAIHFDITVPTFKTRVGYRFYNDTYLGMDDPDNRHNDLNASNHYFNGLLDYNAPFGLMIGGQDEYAILQTYEETEQFLDYMRGDQTHNDARGWLGFKHGPYDNLYFKATYINLIDKYKTYPDYDKMGQYADGELRLKFFPLTAWILQGGYGLVDYERIQAFDSNTWYAMTGLQGQITTHLLVVAKGGWQMADYQENADFSGYLADAELTALFTPVTQWTVGYRRLFRDAADTNYYTTHEGFTRFSWLYGSRLNTTLYGSYQYNDFSTPLDRHEDFVQAEFDLTYRFVYWLYMGGGYRLEYRIFDDGEVHETTTRNIGTIHLQALF